MAHRSPSRVPLRTLAAGFEESRARFNLVTRSAAPDDVFIALLEVVAWAGAIREWLRCQSKAKNRTIAELEGFWFVRNRVVHDGAEGFLHTTRHGLGRYGKAAYGEGEGTWVWKRRAPLTKPKTKGMGNVGKEEYDSHLARKPVSATLATISAELAARVRP